MTRNINLSLSGTKKSNLFVLVNANDQMPVEILKIKSSIMKLIIIPFMSKNWKVLNENLVFFDNIKNKINTYIKHYRNCQFIDFQIYIELLDAFETAIFLHTEVINLEQQLYGSDNMSTLVFRTAMVRLKPELELYNLIFGKPDFKSGNQYNNNIVNDIVTLFTVDNTTFDQIKKAIIHKYLHP